MFHGNIYITDALGKCFIKKYEIFLKKFSSENNNVARKDIGKWTTRDIHDSKFNEEKLAIQFKTGRLGYFGLAISWYSNIPFQTWELKPDTKT